MNAEMEKIGLFKGSGKMDFSATAEEEGERRKGEEKKRGKRKIGSPKNESPGEFTSTGNVEQRNSQARRRKRPRRFEWQSRLFAEKREEEQMEEEEQSDWHVNVFIRSARVGVHERRERSEKRGEERGEMVGTVGSLNVTGWVVQKRGVEFSLVWALGLGSSPSNCTPPPSYQPTAPFYHRHNPTPAGAELDRLRRMGCTPVLVDQYHGGLQGVQGLLRGVARAYAARWTRTPITSW
ncbi:hypothetical protein WH47_09395 [Habropoda laboriosa]|uniref:Uncharacterized protein n=1 Tax=Habropoda laboriosa TaxID=597456 RepID=A0A0L7RER1_9HYME|nr:hypothetical protein WH47_09395 [Habropoda laboriosa]